MSFQDLIFSMMMMMMMINNIMYHVSSIVDYIDGVMILWNSFRTDWLSAPGGNSLIVLLHASTICDRADDEDDDAYNENSNVKNDDYDRNDTGHGDDRKSWRQWRLLLPTSLETHKDVLKRGKMFSKIAKWYV